MTGNVVPSNSSMTSLYPASPLGTFTLHLEARPDPGIHVYNIYIYLYVRICTHTYICSYYVSSCRFTANRARCVCTQLRVQRRLSLVCTRLSTRGSQAFERVGGTVGLPHIRLGVSDAFEITFVPR